MMYTDDPIKDYDRYLSEQEADLDKLPRCSECGQPITDEEAYLINDEIICEHCMEHEHKVFVDDYIESSL